MAEEEIRDPGTVTFNDVAVYFSSREWELLANWQKKLYKNVMKEIHGALGALGYEIANPGILVRIQQEAEPMHPSHDAADEDTMHDEGEQSLDIKSDPMSDSLDTLPELPLLKPDILLRVKMEEMTSDQSCQTAITEGDSNGADSSMAVFNPELSIWIKQEEQQFADSAPSSSMTQGGAVTSQTAPTLPDCPNQTVRPRRTETTPKKSRPRLTNHKRTGLKLRDKILVLCAYENNESVGSLASQFGVSRAQILKIVRGREELLNALQNNVSGDRIRRRRRTTNDQLNSAVWEWLLSTRDTDITLSGRIIRDKALQIASEMGIADFKASNGWLDSFKKAHNIHRCSAPLFGPGTGEERIDEWLSQMRNIDDR
ncbi:uncharacterized protein O3C94_005586 isoform 2-T2 [Discoglossus pictus]